jgi:hypothetical protein
MGNYPWGPHGPQSGPNQVTPNPTPAYVPPPPAPTYAPRIAAPTYANGTAQNAAPVAWGPRKKSYIFAVILALLFGPLGLFYGSKKGALMLLFLLFAVPVALAAMGAYPFVAPSHAFRALAFDSVMNPIYRVCAFCSVIWTVFGVYRHNAWVKAQAGS